MNRNGASLAFATLLGVVFALGSRPTSAEDEKERTWDFESDRPGRIARGFSGEVGKWEIARDGENRVLAQRASNPAETFNVALVSDLKFRDVDISVRLRAVEGELHRGGGVVWRAGDKDNYYIARYNPLEDNFRVYKVEKGQRTEFASAEVSGDAKWHTLRVTMMGRRIACYLDGRKYLEVDDGTFADAGRVGLWSKADARSYFDDLTVAGR